MKKFVLAVWDTSKYIENEFAKAFCKNLAEFWIVEYDQMVDVVIGTDANEVLSKAAATSADWVIFSSLGCHFSHRHEFYETLSAEIDRDPSFVLMGHILDRKDRWYELHDQCFVMNLAAYRDLKMPSLGRRLDTAVEKIVPLRSTENFHDDYTPHWIKATTERAKYSGTEFGHGLLSAVLEAGQEVRAFPPLLRNSKCFFYPKVKGEFSRKFAQWEEHIRHGSNTFFAYNTEEIPPVPADMKKLSFLYTPASGLIFSKILHQLGYEPNCQIHFYDHSLVALKVIERIMSDWDGRDYPAFLRSMKDMETFKNFGRAEEQWKEFVSGFGGEEAWVDFFMKLKNNSDFHLHHCNLFDGELIYQPWAPSQREQPGASLFWMSNIFHYRYTAGYRSVGERMGEQKNLINGLKKREPDLYIYLCSALRRRDHKLNYEICKVRDYDIDKVQSPNFWGGAAETFPSSVRDFAKANQRPTARFTLPEKFWPYLGKKIEDIPELEIDPFCEWIERESLLPWLKLDIPIPHERMLAEARGCFSHFVPHRAEHNHGWQSVCLHGSRADRTEDYYRYGFESKTQAEYKWTEISEFCPVTTDWLKNRWPMESFDRVRFMLLEPGGYITPHNDTGGERGFSATNIALNQPVGCEMAMEKYGSTPWKPGDVRRLDVGVNHSVYNSSNENRFHIIIHGRTGNRYQDWKRLIVSSFLKRMREGDIYG